jgi:hypothetical protein
VVFLRRGDSTRTANYLHLDEGSEFEKALTCMRCCARARPIAQDLAASGLPQWGSWSLLAACVRRKPTADVAALAAALQPSSVRVAC